MNMILGLVILGAIFYFMMRSGGCCGSHGHGKHDGREEHDGHQ